MQSKFLALCLLPFLAACQTTQTSLVPVETPRPQIAIPQAQPMNLRDMEWKVYNAADLERVAAEVQAKKDKNFVLIALTPKGYENLSYNMVEIERYIREQQAVIVYMREVVDGRAGVQQKPE